jgi:hypothetical protein
LLVLVLLVVLPGTFEDKDEDDDEEWAPRHVIKSSRHAKKSTVRSAERPEAATQHAFQS